MTDITPLSTEQQPPPQAEITTQKPFEILNLTFASRKVLINFLLFSFLVAVVPVVMVIFVNNYVQSLRISNLEKVGYTVGPVVFYMNIVIGVYIYKAIKDPENYKKDPPLKLNFKSKKA